MYTVVCTFAALSAIALHTILIACLAKRWARADLEKNLTRKYYWPMNDAIKRIVKSPINQLSRRTAAIERKLEMKPEEDDDALIYEGEL